MNSNNHNINIYMSQALAKTTQCCDSNDIPIGAIIVLKNEIIGIGYNQVEKTNNPLNHAEIIAINDALSKKKIKYLDGCKIFVTLEPCAMCIGAIINARIETVYFGAYESKTGACGSVYNIPENPETIHKTKIYGGIMEEECSKLIKAFFSDLRKSKQYP